MVLYVFKKENMPLVKQNNAAICTSQRRCHPYSFKIRQWCDAFTLISVLNIYIFWLSYRMHWGNKIQKSKIQRQRTRMQHSSLYVKHQASYLNNLSVNSYRIYHKVVFQEIKRIRKKRLVTKYLRGKGVTTVQIRKQFVRSQISQNFLWKLEF